MATSGLVSLSFEHLQEQCEHFIEQLSTENADIHTPYTGTALGNKVSDLGRDFTKLTEVITGMQSRKGVCQQDVLSLESLRPKYPALDRFLSTTPIGMYTRESSAVMYEPTLGVFLDNVSDVLFKALDSFAKWLMEALQRSWSELIALAADGRKNDARLQAFHVLCDYINVVGEQLKDRATLSGFYAAHNRALHDLNSDIRENEVIYLTDPAMYDKLMYILADLVANHLPVLVNQAKSFVSELSAVKSGEQVEVVVGKYTAAIEKQPSVGGIVKALVTLPFIEKSGITSIEPTMDALVKALRVTPMSPKNNAKGEVHPAVFKQIVENPTVFKIQSEGLKTFIMEELPETAKAAKKFCDELKIPEYRYVDVSEAFVRDNVAGLMLTYQQLFKAYGNVQSLIVEILTVRNSALEKLTDIVLDEVKALDKWIGDNKQDLPLGVVALRDAHQKKVMDVVREVRL